MASNILDLARIILAQVEIVSCSIQAAGQPDLSFDTDGGQIPPDSKSQMAKETAKVAAQQLIALLNGPMGIMENTNELDLAALQVIHRFQIAQSFPIGETTTYEQISKKCGIPESRARRVLRYAITNGIFAEPQPDTLAHSALSEALIRDPHVRAEVAHTVEEQFPAAAHLADSIQKHGDSQEGSETSWAIANHTTESMFSELHTNHPLRASNFANFMDIWAKMNSPAPLLSAIEFDAIAKQTAASRPHFVDIGGGKGPVSIHLAQHLPRWTFTVQDYPSTITAATSQSSTLDQAISSRLTYQPYDFISAVQPISTAQIYFFRTILHNWSDKYCVQILRNLIPALTPNARIVFNEVCLPEHGGGSSPIVNRMSRSLDMVMMTLFNGMERSRKDFERVLKEADERFEIVGVTEPQIDEAGVPVDGILSVIEVIWKG